MAITLKNIAEECGLAVSTVSNILNNQKSSFASQKVKKLVKETAKRLGYRKDYLSVSLRTKQTKSIGLCIDRVQDPTRAFFINTFVTAFNKIGYEVAINEHLGNPDAAIDTVNFFSDRYKDGIILFTDFLRDIGGKTKTLLEAIENSQCKVIGIGSELKDRLPSLDIEREWAFIDALTRLERLGSQNILIVYKTDVEFRGRISLLYKENYFHLSETYSLNDFVKGWKELNKSGKKIDGIFFRTDEIAIPALNYFLREGIKVPEDLKVISFDHFPFSEYTMPSLTTYDINFSSLGTLAFTQLYNCLKTGSDLSTGFYKTIKPVFIGRNSHSKETN